MTTDFDVAIVGGGPAGAWAAYRLARGGARVAIVDGSHPREKPCGGGVTGRAFELVRDAIDPSSFDAVTIETARFAAGTRTATMRLDESAGGPALSVVARKIFDRALLDAAITAGATHIATRAADVARQNAGWRVETAVAAISAQWLVGADGANSLVRRRVSAPFRRRDLSIATGYFVHGTTSREIEVVFETNPPGYLWSFPRPDHLAVGVGAQADESSSAVLLKLAETWIHRHVPAAGTRLERYSWPIPSLGTEALLRERPGGDGWMLVGDAAGLVDPITREGIFFAIASGDAAAAALLGTDPARTYAAYVRQHIHPELARAARLKARFFQPRFTALMIHALRRSGRVRAVMADLVAGRQTYQGLRRRLLRTFEWRLMLSLLGQRQRAM